MSNATATDNLLVTQNLHKKYRMGSEDLHVLRGVDVSVKRGEWLCILGRSGSGKSTLLHLMGGLDTPDKGHVVFDKEDVFAMSTAARDHFRNTHVGFVFQFYHLLPELTTLENVLMPLMITHGAFSYWRNKRRHLESAQELLEMVGLSHRLKHPPCELSGGEMQRAAIARALVAEPDVLLADEPTGNLDPANKTKVLDILFAFAASQGSTLVAVTHDHDILDRFDRAIDFKAYQRTADVAA